MIPNVFRAVGDSEGIVWSALTGRLPRVLTPVAWAAFVLFTALVFVYHLSQSTPAQDEGVLLTYPWLMDHGLLPYRDFWATYPPGTYTVLALIYGIVGETQLIERTTGMLLSVAIVLMANRMLTGSWIRFSLLGIPAASLLFWGFFVLPTAETFGILFLLPGLYFVRRPPLAAVFFFVGATFRWEVGIIGLIALTSYAALLSLNERRLCVRELLTGSLLLLAALGLGVEFLQAVTSGKAIGQIVIFQLGSGEAGRVLPLWPPDYPTMFLPSAALVLLGPPIMALVSWLYRCPFLAATNFALIGVTSWFLHRVALLNLAMSGTVVATWLLYSFVMLRRSPKGQDARTAGARSTAAEWGRYATAGVLLIGLLVGLVPSLQMAHNAEAEARYVAIHGFANTVPLESRTILADTAAQVGDIASIARYLKRHAAPHERIFVGLTDNRHSMYNQTDLYFVLNRMPCGQYLEYVPGLESTHIVQRNIIASLASCDWIVLWKGGFWYEPNASQDTGSNILDVFLRDHYRRVLDNADFIVGRRVQAVKAT